MPKTDTFLQRLGSASLGLVEHTVAPRPRLSGEGWSGWCSYDRWVIDYVDGSDMHAEVVEPGAVMSAFTRQPGTWHCYAPGTVYRERYPQVRKLREWMWFFFTLGSSLPPLTGRGLSIIADPDGRLSGYCRTMYAHQQRGGAGSDLALRSLLHAALAEILVASSQGGDGSPARPWRMRGSSTERDADLQQRLDRLILADLTSTPSLEDLATALGMSTSNLSHRFKAESGMTVVERARWLRIREARRLLADGLDVKTVTRRLGFSSPSYFARVFIAFTGITPLDYQRRSIARN